MHVLIRADGGAEIGYGHLFRSGSLAEKLIECGHEVTYATTTPGEVSTVCPSGIETVELAERAEMTPRLERLVAEQIVVVVADSYEVDEKYQQELRALTPLVLISDDARYPVCADVLVNGNLYAEDLSYNFIGDEPVRCLGPDYLLLRGGRFVRWQGARLRGARLRNVS